MMLTYSRRENALMSGEIESSGRRSGEVSFDQLISIPSKINRRFDVWFCNAFRTRKMFSRNNVFSTIRPLILFSEKYNIAMRKNRMCLGFRNAVIFDPNFNFFDAIGTCDRCKTTDYPIMYYELTAQISSEGGTFRSAASQAPSSAWLQMSCHPTSRILQNEISTTRPTIHTTTLDAHKRNNHARYITIFSNMQYLRREKCDDVAFKHTLMNQREAPMKFEMSGLKNLNAIT